MQKQLSTRRLLRNSQIPKLERRCAVMSARCNTQTANSITQGSLLNDHAAWHTLTESVLPGVTLSMCTLPSRRRPPWKNLQCLFLPASPMRACELVSPVPGTIRRTTQGRNSRAVRGQRSSRQLTAGSELSSSRITSKGNWPLKAT